VDIEGVALSLVASIYEGALRPESADGALGRVADGFPGHVLALGLRLPGGSAPPLLYDHGSDPAYVASYLDHYHAVDFTQQPLSRLPVGSILATHRDVGREAASRTEFYNDWMRPAGLAWGPT